MPLEGPSAKFLSEGTHLSTKRTPKHRECAAARLKMCLSDFEELRPFPNAASAHKLSVKSNTRWPQFLLERQMCLKLKSTCLDSTTLEGSCCLHCVANSSLQH